MILRGTQDKRARFMNRGAFDTYGKNKWVLKEDVSYYSPLLLKVIKVPKGFIFDFASIPRVGRLLIPKEGYHRYAALLHDWLYYSHEASKEDSDLIFREAMGVLRTPQWKRNTMYRTVKWFGSSSYGKRGKVIDPARIVDVNSLPNINRKYKV